MNAVYKCANSSYLIGLRTRVSRQYSIAFPQGSIRVFSPGSQRPPATLTCARRWVHSKVIIELVRGDKKIAHSRGRNEHHVFPFEEKQRLSSAARLSPRDPWLCDTGLLRVLLLAEKQIT